MRKIHIFLSCVLNICAFFALTVPTFAASADFSTQLTSTYIVQPSGLTKVEKKFQITNNTPTLYISQYALEIGSGKLANVVVSSDSNKIPANVVTTDNSTSIAVTFPDQVVGEGKVRTFTVSYDSSDTAVVAGSTLEVYLPKLSSAKEYTNHQTVLKIPRQFGKPVRVVPAEFTATEDSATYSLSFNQVGDKAVTALFGNQQYFNFDLKYEVTNTTNNVGVTQIALPPDTPNQRLLYDQIEPRPKEMVRDADGNWIATYEVESQKNLQVRAVGRALLTIEPNQVPATVPGSIYTSAQKYWEIDDPQIKDLASKYTSPRQIYDYLISTFQYNYDRAKDRAERLGAQRAISEPDQAICQEFADAFIALARANGIPARRLTGYAYTANSRLRPLGLIQDVLHAWPEYYDQQQKRWVAIDPTWGQTTGGVNYFDQLDFNHFVFAINGQSSNLPYAAGSYRSEQDTSKHVDVSFSKVFEFPEMKVAVTVKKIPWFLSPFQNQFVLAVKNETGAASYNIPVALHADGVPLEKNQLNVPVLLPYQTVSLPFALNESAWQPRSFTLTAQIQQLSSSHELHSGFNSQDFREAPQLAISLGGSVVVIAIIAGGVLVSRRPRQRSVRRQSQKS